MLRIALEDGATGGVAGTVGGIMQVQAATHTWLVIANSIST